MCRLAENLTARHDVVSSRDTMGETSPSQGGPGRDCWRAGETCTKTGRVFGKCCSRSSQSSMASEGGGGGGRRDTSGEEKGEVVSGDTSCGSMAGWFRGSSKRHASILSLADRGSPCPSFRPRPRPRPAPPPLPDEPAARRRSTALHGVIFGFVATADPVAAAAAGIGHGAAP